LRKKKAEAVWSLEDYPEAALVEDGPDGFDAGERFAPERPLLLRLAEDVQDGVRRRVDERTWRVFWKIAVVGQSVREASEAAGISYYAAFAAQKRVGRMLREEGQRLLAGRRDDQAPYGPEID
jgi:hypothetical protein